MYTTDNQNVLYTDIYSDTNALFALLTLEKENRSLVCHIFVIIQPYKISSQTNQLLPADFKIFYLWETHPRQ